MKNLLTLIIISGLLVFRFGIERQSVPEMVTPMGHKMEFIREIDEGLYEYKDTYTDIHYLVSVIGDTETIYRPVFENGQIKKGD